MLTLDGDDITQNFSDRLISLTMTDNRGFEADQLDIELDDTDGLVELPPRGAKLTLWLGWQGSALLNKGSQRKSSAGDFGVQHARERARGFPLAEILISRGFTDAVI
ncbi:hypothetical protein UO98_20915 [Enterobacter hormaechei]|nr:hypothetical protein UO98_20915 [Enterobacter hormaechei]